MIFTKMAKRRANLFNYIDVQNKKGHGRLGQSEEHLLRYNFVYRALSRYIFIKCSSKTHLDRYNFRKHF